MNGDERMSIQERWKYLRLMQRRYRKADRSEKGRLLGEAEAVTGLHRKSLIRRLNSPLQRQRRQRQRDRTYGVAVQAAIQVISESVDYVCAERLQPNLTWLAQHLVEHGELEVSPELQAQLEQISIPTVRRILRRLAQDQPRLPRKRPATTNRAAKQVPIAVIAWDEQQPGHVEADLVHHSGPVTSGHYVHSLQMIDVATGWSERVAMLGRSYRVMKDGFRRILIRLPFPLQHVHSDNGSEFINDHLLRFWQKQEGDISLSRGRPQHKNDQRFVEQKNSTLIRAYLGYERFDTVVQTRFLNLLYNKMWLFYNFFQPVMRLAEKKILSDTQGRRQVKRRYDRARTPFDRLCETGVLSSSQQQRLTALRQRTNPRQLRKEIHDLIEQILVLPGAGEDETEDIFNTLLTTKEEQRLRWAAGYVDKSETDPDLSTCPLLCPSGYSPYYCHWAGMGKDRSRIL
jgi:hypothetical protein